MSAPTFKPSKAVGNAYKVWKIKMKAYYFWPACVTCAAAGFIAGLAAAR